MQFPIIMTILYKAFPTGSQNIALLTPPGKIAQPNFHSLPPLNNNLHAIILSFNFSNSHFCFIAFLTSCSNYTYVMLILILIDVIFLEIVYLELKKAQMVKITL